MSELIYTKFVDEEFDDAGVLKSIKFKYPSNFNFAFDVMDELEKKNPNKTALVWVGEDKSNINFTYKQLMEKVNQTANFFVSIGIKKGDVIMLVLKRHYQFWFSILALHKIGAIALPATNQLVEKDFVYRFEKSHAKGIVCTSDDSVSDEVELATKTYKNLKYKIIVKNPKKDWMFFDDCIKNMKTTFSRSDADSTLSTDTMLMFFSSGTTGYPKLAKHTFSYPLGHIVTARHWHNLDDSSLHLTIAETGWGKAAWGKIYGQWLCESRIFVYDFERFHPNELLPLIKEYQITSLCAPPTMFRMFIKEDLSQYDLSSIKNATIAGEALNPEVLKSFKKSTNINLVEAFGQTESTVLLGNLVGIEPKPGSMGKVNPQYEVELMKPDGTFAKTGEVGEIVVRADINNPPVGLFSGYYEDEKNTAATWYDGYYHTFDLAWKDEDSYYWYVGRTDDVIKSSGYRIGPFEIESVLIELPYVLECAVIGIPDPVRGQVVKACVVLASGYSPSEEMVEEMKTYVKEHTAPYKYPRIIEFFDQLPKTISGKIIRKDLRKLCSK